MWLALTGSAERSSKMPGETQTMWTWLPGLKPARSSHAPTSLILGRMVLRQASPWGSTFSLRVVVFIFMVSEFEFSFFELDLLRSLVSDRVTVRPPCRRFRLGFVVAYLGCFRRGGGSHTRGRVCSPGGFGLVVSV